MIGPRGVQPRRERLTVERARLVGMRAGHVQVCAVQGLVSGHIWRLRAGCDQSRGVIFPKA
jgi:hypothetical protein